MTMRRGRSRPRNRQWRGRGGSARAGACLGSNRREVDLHQRALGDGGVEVAGAGADPAGGPNSGLHGSPQALLGHRDRRVHLVAVRRTKIRGGAHRAIGNGGDAADQRERGPVSVRTDITVGADPAGGPEWPARRAATETAAYISSRSAKNQDVDVDRSVLAEEACCLMRPLWPVDQSRVEPECPLDGLVGTG